MQIPITDFQSISIEGYICTKKTNIVVEVEQAVAYGDTILPIHDAVVELHGNDSIYSFYYDDEKECYFSDKKIKGEVGRAYTLKVWYNNKEYTATDIMPPYPNDEVNLPMCVFTEYHDIYNRHRFYAHNFGYAETNEWSFDNYWDADYDPKDDPEYDKIFGWKFNLSNIITTHKGINVQAIIFPDDFGGNFSIINDSIGVYKLGVTDQYVEFVNGYYTETTWKGNPFESQPGNVKTNVTGGGYGFFAAKSVIYKKVPLDEFQIIEK